MTKRFKPQIAKTENQKLQRERAFAAAARARRDGISLTKAAEIENTTLSTVRKYLPVKKVGTHYSVGSFDRQVRTTTYLLPSELGGPATVSGTFHDSRTVAKVNAYMRDIMRYIEGKDTYSVVAKWKGQSFTLGGAKVRFVTDKNELYQWAQLGEPDYVEFGSG